MFEKLKYNIENCKFCEKLFGFEPHPIFWGNQKSKIVQISQAPSKDGYQSLKPFTDASGKTLLHKWYLISEEEFYDKNNFYIAALAHCFPGKDNQGNDRLPPSCCFERWLKKELELVENEIYIIVGAKAAKKFFPNDKFEDLVFKNNYWHGKLTIVIPHPSPLNNRWIKAHPKFLEERILEIRKIIKKIIS